MAGSGKSTQRDLLVKQLDCNWIYPGELLRTNLVGGEKANLLAGKHIDDGITIPLLDEDFLKKDIMHLQCVLDGAPRSLRQAKWFTDKIKAGEFKLTGFIHLIMTEAEAIRRLSGRARADDNRQSMAERFKVYETRTKPVIGYLESHGIKVHSIDATASIEEVNNRIRQALGLKQPAEAVNS